MCHSSLFILFIIYDIPISNIESEIIEVEKSINATLSQKDFGNLTDFQKFEYHESLSRKMMDWNIQLVKKLPIFSRIPS